MAPTHSIVVFGRNQTDCWRPADTVRWRTGLRFEHAVHHIVLEDCIAAVEAATARRDRLEAHIAAALPDWSLAPVVHALQALRGMALVAAATLVAELGDITRFRLLPRSLRHGVAVAILASSGQAKARCEPILPLPG